MMLYRFHELFPNGNAVDRVRGAQIPSPGPTLDYLEEAFTSENWIVRTTHQPIPPSLPPSVHFFSPCYGFSSRHIFVVYFSQFCYSVLYGLSLFPPPNPLTFSFAYYCINLGEHEWLSLPSLISPFTTLNQETFPLSPTSMPTQQYCIPLPLHSRCPALFMVLYDG